MTKEKSQTETQDKTIDVCTAIDLCIRQQQVVFATGGTVCVQTAEGMECVFCGVSILPFIAWDQKRVENPIEN